MTPLNQKGYKRIVLSAGHGGSDVGAVFGQYREADQTIYIVNKMAQILKVNNYDILIIPHNLDSGKNFANANYKEGDLAIEIHRDSAVGLSEFDASTRIGCYYMGGSNFAKEYSDQIMEYAKAQTGNKNCWSRPDTQVRFGKLEWSRDVKAFSLLFEMAFMQGKNSNEHLDYLANLGAKMINKIWTGQYDFQNTKPAPTVINIPNSNSMTDLNQKLKIAFIDNNQKFMYKERKDVMQNAINVGDMNYLGWELGNSWQTIENLDLETKRLYNSEASKDKILADYKTTVETYNITGNNTILEKDNLIKELEAQIGVLQQEKSLFLSNDTNWNAQIDILKKELEKVKLENEKIKKQVFDSGQVPGVTSELITKIDSDSKNLALRFLEYIKNLPNLTKYGGGSLAVLIPILQTQIEQSNFSLSTVILTATGMLFTMCLPTGKK